MAAPSVGHHLEGGVAAGQRERDELGLVTQLGEEHDGEGSQDVSHERTMVGRTGVAGANRWVHP